MNGDFARVTFDPASAYSRVLLQQGRMLLESDFNEQSAIQLHFLRSLIVDLIGRCWRAGKDSFRIDAGDGADFAIGAGRFYVDGIPCDNTAQDLTYHGQFGSGPVPDTRSPSGNWFLVYLECWERHLSAIQRPALRDAALGGVDTASRAKIEWQARILDARAADRVEQAVKALEIRQKATPEPQRAAIGDEIETLKKLWDEFVATFSKKVNTNQEKEACRLAQMMLDALDAAPPHLRARAQFDAPEDDPCEISADAAYRGRENQLYRVEIHRAGLAGEGATFKWSRENASVQFAVRSTAVKDGNVVTLKLDDLGRDKRTGLCERQWVELTGDAVELGLAEPVMARIASIDRDRRTITAKIADGDAISADPKVYTLLRRWDHVATPEQHGTLAVGESASENAGWIALERGVEIQFAPGAVYQAGDYWLVPTRTATADVEWPQDGDGKRLWGRKHGTARHRAALGFARRASSTADWTYQTCGCTIVPLCQQNVS